MSWILFLLMMQAPAPVVEFEPTNTPEFDAGWRMGYAQAQYEWEKSCLEGPLVDVRLRQVIEQRDSALRQVQAQAGELELARATKLDAPTGAPRPTPKRQ